MCHLNTPCDKGEGECTLDHDCKCGLRCGKRETGLETLPGITIDAGVAKPVASTTDVCYDPNDDPCYFKPKDGTGFVAGVNKGESGCTVSNPCNIGEGDCDNDN